ncbi:threonine synthase [Collinsella tanakaei]|jgi:threonine synthase|uniref:Threonine synthase n=1 Tax=Collinsella tanakaei TaxID=626935 RepID=A0A3E4QTG9_9ACTN|nr:threonine synthase [Collinsella tanakaei]RGL10084.1 threonine synthase [Collinsella tanakaei]
MATYHSTRSRTAQLSAKEAIRRGIAPDGGLYVSDELGQSKIDLEGLANKDYFELAREVLGTLLPDYTADEIAACVDEAYGSSFASDEVTPVVDLKGVAGEADQGSASTYVMELWHGPTSAFKDVALQMLPRLMARTSANAEGAADKIMIVTATSGDTGKAALAGFADAPGCGITVFYPEGKVSRVQELQMSTQEGANVSVCAVRGNFDDAQSAVKRIFADRELADRLAAAGVQLSSANSINVGRLVPQVVYYFAAYAQLLRAGKIQPGDAVEFCVPTGNFGDILAGYYAQRLGLPVAKLIVASDKNNVLFDFLTTGTYDRQRPFYTTTSPSMDILISSNLERMLYYLADGDCELVANLMAQLAQGSYDVPAELLAKIQAVFGCGWADEDQVAAAIKDCWDRNGYLIDPHTACGYHVLGQVPAAPDAKARVVLSTASPYKFPRAVAGSLGLFCPPDDFACMNVLEKATGTVAPAQLSELQQKPVLHDAVVDIDGMGGFVEQAASKL